MGFYKEALNCSCQTHTLVFQCSYSVQVCPLVLGSVTGVAESFLAARVLAQVRLLSSVTPQVNLQILQTRKGLITPFKLRKRWGRGRERKTSHIFIVTMLLKCCHRERERESERKEKEPSVCVCV